MAQDITVTGAIPFDVTAGADLRTHQHKLVQISAAGVRLALNATSGPTFVLWNKPSSADFVSLIGPPNVSKVWVDSATLRGQYLTLSAATSGVAVMMPTTSLGTGLAFGIALSSVASGSLCDVLLI